LDRLIEERGVPQNLRSDNGPEFTSRRMLRWAEERKINLVHIQPGRPTQNGHVESFHGRLRDECLNVSWFRTLNTERRAANLGELSAGVQLRTPTQLAGIQNATGVRSIPRLWRCGKQSNERVSGNQCKRLREYGVPTLGNPLN
jgi:putative transposase